MNISALCPCCYSKLIRHIDGHRDYWFCRTCWTEMPIIDRDDTESEDNYERDRLTTEKTINSHKNTYNLSHKIAMPPN